MRLGLPGAIRALLDFFAAVSDEPCTDDPYLAAIMLAGLGEGDAMFECLEDTRTDDSKVYPKVEPEFDPYRSDPRFQAILEGMGLAD